MPCYHLLPRWNGDTCSLARSNDTHVTCTCFRFASYSVLLQHDSLQGNFYGSSQRSSSSSGDLHQALSNGGSKRQGEGLDSAAVIAIAVLSACLAIVFIMAAAILAVYYRRVKVSHSMKKLRSCLSLKIVSKNDYSILYNRPA